MRTDSLVDNIATALANEIVGGTYRIGDQLPSNSALSVRFGVKSDTTIRTAIQRLARIGLVQPVHGVGVFVRDIVRKPERVYRDQIPLIQSFDDDNHSVEVELRVTEIPPGWADNEFYDKASLLGATSWGAAAGGHTGFHFNIVHNFLEDLVEKFDTLVHETDRRYATSTWPEIRSNERAVQIEMQVRESGNDEHAWRTSVTTRARMLGPMSAEAHRAPHDRT
jgi:DNA-binding transcriptional regulator YhcF (GntR family)